MVPCTNRGLVVNFSTLRIIHAVFARIVFLNNLRWAAVDDLWDALPQPRCNVPNFCVSGRRPGLTQRAARRPGKVIEATAGWVDGTWEPSRRLNSENRFLYISRAMVPTGALGEGRWKSSLRDLQRTRNFLSRLRLPHACDGGKAY